MSNEHTTKELLECGRKVHEEYEARIEKQIRESFDAVRDRLDTGSADENSFTFYRLGWLEAINSINYAREV